MQFLKQILSVSGSAGAPGYAVGEVGTGYWRPANAVLAISVSSTEVARWNGAALRIGNTGGLGVASRLSVSFTGQNSEYGLIWRPAADAAGSVVEGFQNAAGTLVGSIAVSASTTAYNTSSDKRVKREITPLDAGDLIDRLEPCRYIIDLGTPEPGLGFLAQDLAAVVPEAVTLGDEDPDARPGDEGFRMWAVDQSKLIPLLVAELQACRKRIAWLEKTARAAG